MILFDTWGVHCGLSPAKKGDRHVIVNYYRPGENLPRSDFGFDPKADYKNILVSMKKNSLIQTLDNEKIAVFSYGRKNSKRCYNKLLRKFHNTTIVDILLDKLSKFENSYFGGYDKEFEIKCKKHGVKFLKRSKKSVNIDYPISECLKFVNKIDQEYLLLVNACLPFLSIRTINEFLNSVIRSNFKSTSLLVRKDNYFLIKIKNLLILVQN